MLAVFRAIEDRRPGALRARPVRRLPRRSTASRRTRPPRRSPRCGSRSTTGAGRACRSSSAPASCMPVTQTELRLVFKRPPRLGFARIDGGIGAEPARRQARPVDRRPASCSTPTAPTSTRPEPIKLDMEFAEEGGEGATPYEVLLHAAMIGDSTRFTRQDGVEETWRIMQPLLDSPPPVHPYAPGHVGPGGGRRARRGPRPAGTGPGIGRRGADDGALRRDHRRHRAPAAARSPGTSRRPASGSCCSSAATGCRASRRTGAPQAVFVDNRYVSPDTWYDENGKAVPAADPLLRRRRDQALRRRALPAARRGLRRAAPPRRHLARLADLLRRARAVLHARPSSSTRCTAPAARTRPSRPRARRTRSRPSRTSRASSSSRTSSQPHGYHPFHAPCGIMLDEAKPAVQRVRALRELRRLPVPRARQVGRRRARRAPGARAPERHAADERAGREARDERRRARR